MLDVVPVIGLAVWAVILATAPIRRPDLAIMPETFKGTIFLLALVTCASLMPVEELPRASWQTALGLGFLSSVFDNIPLTALAIKQGGYDWGYLAYTVGFGGSMIWFGSSAGVALSNMYPDAKSVGSWVKNGWPVAVAYVFGFFVMLAILGWKPDAPHKQRVALPAIQRHNGGCVMTFTLLQWMTLAVFAVTIIAIVVSKLDATVAALLGVAVMVWMGTMTEVEAAQLVDWNVMAILIGIWIIAGYFGRTGVPSWLSVQSLKLSGEQASPDCRTLDADGILSMFIDNVVCILMTRRSRFRGACARASGDADDPDVRLLGNFMGTALLFGVLPPQMLHSVAGAEFFDFIWQHGRPSSFPILMVTFRHHAGVHVFLRFPQYRARVPGRRRKHQGGYSRSDVRVHHGRDVPADRAGMAFREAFGVKLGFIALTGAIILVLILEILGDKLKEAPSFEHIVQELDWRAVFFYIALFALVGGLEKTHILDMMANAMKPLFITNYALGASLLYWATIPIVGLVEHDAYILTFLYMIKDRGAQGIPTWPLWWMVLWSGTLGSNLTVAGAPALYVALRIAEKEENRKVSLREFLSWSLVFCLVSSFDLLHLRHADLGSALFQLRDQPSCSRTFSSRQMVRSFRRRQCYRGVALAKAVGASVTGFCRCASGDADRLPATVCPSGLRSRPSMRS